MREVTEKAYAKINISLDVTGKRSDGYHDMLMVMQTVTLCDNVTVELVETEKSYAICNLPFVPGDERNLTVRAANKFFEKLGRQGAAKITLKKLIPVGAGMAGGSSDAAAVIRALNTLCGKPLDRAGLEELAAEIGSDVAFCVSGGTALASGRGEILTPLPPMPDCSIVICKPDFSISTPELFRKLDSVKLRCHPDTAGIKDALNEGNLLKLARRMYNVFEDVPDRRFNTVAEIKSGLLDHGALGAVMTGTGSAVFGIFSDAQTAENAAEAMKKNYSCCFVSKNKTQIEV